MIIVTSKRITDFTASNNVHTFRKQRFKLFSKDSVRIVIQPALAVNLIKPLLLLEQKHS